MGYERDQILFRENSSCSNTILIIHSVHDFKNPHHNIVYK